MTTDTEPPDELLSDEELEALATDVIEGRLVVDEPKELIEDQDRERASATPEPEQSLGVRIAMMTVGDRVKLALRGNRDARMILIRDTNRLIQRFVMQNPRISEEEIAAIARTRTIDGDLLRRIGGHKIWSRNYQIRLALVTNPRTPPATSLPMVPGLAARDLRQIGKSKNVPSAIAAQARRIILARGG